MESAVGGTLFVVSTHLLLWYQHVSAPLLYVVMGSQRGDEAPPKETDAAIRSGRAVGTIQSILSRCPTLKKLYFPPILFSNAHLQLIPFLAQSWWRRVVAPPCRWVTEHALLADGEIVNLDWANETPPSDPLDNTPYLMIHHGAFGNTQDFPNQTYISEALKRGWRVCVFNRRGHGRKLTRPKFNLMGSTEDVRHVTQLYLRDRRPMAPVFMLGISAGSGVLARYMGEQGLHESNLANEIEGYCTAAVGVSPGYNIEICFDRVMPPYSSMLLDSGKKFYLQENQDVLGGCETYEECLRAENIQTWLDLAWSMSGHSSKEEFYDRTNPMRVIDKIKEPFLCLNAEDDPLCVAQNIVDHIHLFHDGREHNAAVALTKTGGHCCFLELNPHRPLALSCWSERVVFEFFDSVMSHMDGLS